MEYESAHFAFIDESYAVPGKFVTKTFYILAVAIVPASALSDARAEFVTVADTDFLHSSDLMKTSAGQRYLTGLMAQIPEPVELQGFVCEPLIRGDRFGEATRVALFEAAIESLVKQFGSSLEIIYERRSPGAQQQADQRLAAKLRDRFGLTGIRPRSPGDEHMLWIPDLAATALRQETLWSNRRFLDAFRRPIRIELVAAGT